MKFLSDDWLGFKITGLLLGISSITLSNVAITCTAFSGLATGLYTLWKWYHHYKQKKELKNKTP